MDDKKPIKFQRIANWLDINLKNFKLKAKAFNINIYENEFNYSLELVATASFDPDNEDWACDEIYSSGDYRHVFNAKNWEAALLFTENAIKYYLECGKYAEKLKNSCAVACGFVDGNLSLIYVK